MHRSSQNNNNLKLCEKDIFFQTRQVSRENVLI